MTTQIEVADGDRNIAFTLDWEQGVWQSPEELEEGDFPLIAVVDGKRLELYSDYTFAEVERDFG